MYQISIYIHWPFCRSLCPYCDFNSHVADQIDQIKWLESYVKEINYFEYKIKDRKVKSIFFGGGTPSLMSPFIVDKIVNEIARIGIIENDCEITLEVNPNSYETEKFKEFKASGINRVSLGIQSLNDCDLKILGRDHSSTEAINAIKSASIIFARYSFDLIYARPNQTLQSWQKEIKLAIQLAGNHVSLYQLTIEKGTEFFKLFRNKKIILPSDEDSAKMYKWTNEYLLSNGFCRYEISNYAKKGQECLHNLCYWNYEEYIGIGPGAHSRLHQDKIVQSIMMIHSPNRWLTSVNKVGHGIQTQCSLKPSEIVEEIVMMGTRLVSGIQEKVLYSLTGLNFKDILDEKIVEQYIAQHLLKWKNHKIYLTNKGLILHNYLVPRMLKNFS